MSGLPRLVLDTNIVLDLFVFDDAPARALKGELEAGAWDWVATTPMRDELERVLAYPQIAPRLKFYGLDPAQVLTRFDAHARRVDVAAKASVTCKDADDQKFIDLAVAHQGTLLSKDRAVTSMARRLRVFEVQVRSAL
ncbi:MAG: PIN domain-containing protein [Pseudomonadota bacterium]